MRLTRCADQSRATLDEFYAVENENPFPDGKRAMLDLIARLRSLPDEQCVWGLTSLYRLCLLAEDTWKSPWFVIIGASNRDEYHIEYSMPSYLAPWPEAYVKGEAKSIDQAVQMIVTAMQKSEGWKGT
jgi:hypothetical protein